MVNLREKLKKILEEKENNYISPFLWMHGEDEKTIREYMQAIYNSNIRSVCVESRPHPQFCGAKWWEDMDVVLDEARKKNMKVWILDDSHFPTGYANGGLKNKDSSLYRRGIICRKYNCRESEDLILSKEELETVPEIAFSKTEELLSQMGIYERGERYPETDQLLGIVAKRCDRERTIVLKPGIQGGLHWRVPQGEWTVFVILTSCGLGYHRDYINMLEKESCKVLLDSVYEPHWERYKDDFGKTIAGFFSDEPELGNGHIYDNYAIVGIVEDLPWSNELQERLIRRWGAAFLPNLTFLWGENKDLKRQAQVRYDYMDEVTRLVEKNFSMQIGEWCHKHNVEYIGHMIEDNGQHARTGNSLGHYFRGLAGQDMAGIDDIGGQVIPQGEDVVYDEGPLKCRDGEFYHFMLGSLGASLAAIDPRKKGRAMCEIFGNYGWSEGVRLEKYLLDHFMVRGINYFVPHAFSMKSFPDPDCPPHFYANGNDPLYRHFGKMMKYTNRICELLSNGRHISTVAVIYHGEGEWTGKILPSQCIGRILTEEQVGFEYIPLDVFAQRKKYKTYIENGSLYVNTQRYKTIVVPEMEYITEEFVDAVEELKQNEIKVIFAGQKPTGILTHKRENLFCENKSEYGEIMTLAELKAFFKKEKSSLSCLVPENTYLRCYEYEYTDKSGCIMLVNEGVKEYDGILKKEVSGRLYEYDAWNNCIYEAETCKDGIHVLLRPLQSVILLYGLQGEQIHVKNVKQVRSNMLVSLKEMEKNQVPFLYKWKRSICRSINYPEFIDKKDVTVPDELFIEKKNFSGFARYENAIYINQFKNVMLFIEDAHEGIEVFVNGVSVGMQCVPPFYYVLTEFVHCGENQIVIEVASTLERELADIPDMLGQKQEATGKTGITGKVLVYEI